MFVVCADVDADGNALLASVSSWKNNLCDPTCRLDAGIHPFIVKESYILYRKSRIEPASALEKGIAANLFAKLDDVSEKVVGAILDGFLESGQTPRKIKSYVQKL